MGSMTAGVSKQLLKWKMLRCICCRDDALTSQVARQRCSFLLPPQASPNSFGTSMNSRAPSGSFIRTSRALQSMYMR